MGTCVRAYECTSVCTNVTYVRDPVRLRLRHLYQVEFCNFKVRYPTAGASVYCGHISIFFFSILQIWSVEIQISRSISESPLDFEIRRVDCDNQSTNSSSNDNNNNSIISTSSSNNNKSRSSSNSNNNNNSRPRWLSWMRVRLETRRSRVRLPPRSATFFRGDLSWNIFYGHSLPFADSRRTVVSFWRKNVHNTG